MASALQVRLSLRRVFKVCAPLAGAFGGLLASGFLATDGFGMVRTWRISKSAPFLFARLTPC